MNARRACATRLWLGLALFAVACRRAAAPAADAVARIGETDVGYAEFERYVRRNVGDVGSLGNDVLSQLFDQFLEERLLARLAVDQRRAPADADPRQALSALIAAAPQPAPTDEEIARYYQAHRGEFARPERVRLRQILTEDRATAERARREIAAGTPFEVVARRLAQGNGGPKTASAVGVSAISGELARGDLPPSFADLIFALRPGEVSPVVPASYGFHLFQVVSRQPAEVVALAAARGEIVAKLREEAADRRLRALVEEARGRYNTKVYERNLPFGYEGAYREKHAQKIP
jgi:parvulin-like peptidyl-prolyl isomerase